jgi:hypothetical protein
VVTYANGIKSPKQLTIKEKGNIMGKGRRPSLFYNQKKYDANYGDIDFSSTRKRAEENKKKKQSK